ncbi:hypothetical protein EZS27_020678, partial [termite gut metagenome]
MNKSILYILTIITYSFVLYSCEDIIDINLRSVSPKIVIEGSVYLDSLPTIHITTTKDFNETNEYPLVKDAVVEIWDNVGNRETLLFKADIGRYVATNPRLKGIERRVYHLSVKYKEEEYQASSVMKPLVRLDSLTLSRIPLLDYPCPTVHFTTPTQKENGGYRCVTHINDRLRNNEMLISSGHIENKLVHLIIPVFRRDKESDDPIKQGDEITVELQCLDEELY